MKTWIITTATVFAMAFSTFAQAQTFPNRPIELHYPFPAGGISDAFYRVLAQSMSKRLGVPVQVINKPGGGGVVGTAEALRAKPDGHTLIAWLPGPALTQILAGTAPYSFDDYVPVAGCFVNNLVFAAQGDIPANNLKELGEWAKKTGKPVVVGTFSPVALTGLITAKVAKEGGWPYKIISVLNPSAQQLIAGDVDLTTAGADLIEPQVRAGKVKVLSAWLPERLPIFPDVPTLKEENYGDLYLWVGLMAPKGTPKDIVNRISEVVRDSMKDKEVVDLLEKQGAPALYMTADEAAKRIENDRRWISDLMSELGLKKR